MTVFAQCCKIESAVRHDFFCGGRVLQAGLGFCRSGAFFERRVVKNTRDGRGLGDVGGQRFSGRV